MNTNRLASFASRVATELGVYSILDSSRDTKLLCLQRFTRLFAYGASTLILALYLSSLKVSDARIGLFMTLTLLGDVVISFVLTFFADGFGRRRILTLGAALMSVSGFVFAFSDSYWILVAASILGVISPSGNEIGPFKAVEESTLAQLNPSAIRSDIFAWYTLIGTAGTASGTIICGFMVERLQSRKGWKPIRAYRVIFAIYAFLGIVKLVLSLMLSEACEPEPEKQDRHEATELGGIEAEGLLSDDEDGDRTATNKAPSASVTKLPPKKKFILPRISPASRDILFKLCLLFSLDSIGAGLAPASWVTYFFTRKFSLPEGQLGTLFFVTNIISSASNLVASSISKRIGLVQTMVFTHLPSAIFLALIPVPSNVGLAMTFLILRSCTQSMDQAPRQAFLAAVVLPNERTAVMGIVNVVKTLSQSAGPVVTGWLAGLDKFWLAFLLAGGLKASYDLGMLRLFLGFKVREDESVPQPERRRGDEGDESGRP